ncbi:MAG: chromosome partitioning protein [Yoonia sp.]
MGDRNAVGECNRFLNHGLQRQVTTSQCRIIINIKVFGCTKQQALVKKQGIHAVGEVCDRINTTAHTKMKRVGAAPPPSARHDPRRHEGYRVLCVDFDPQATLSHSMGLNNVSEENTVWGIMARDLVRQTDAQNNASKGAASGTALPHRTIPSSIIDLGLQDLRVADFIQSTNWPTIDLIPSCTNAAFVEFASAQYCHLNPEWSFFAAVSRFLNHLPDDQWDLIFFDCPPVIGYQSMNAVFAADMLYVPSGPGYWEYDSTTSFIGQLYEALEDLAHGFGDTLSADKVTLPKVFHDIRFLLTRYEPGNDLHRAMQGAFGKVFGDKLATHPVEMTRAVEQSGRFLSSIYEMDYRDMTRETWRRARASFDQAYGEFRDVMLPHWETFDAPPDQTLSADKVAPEGENA